MQFLDYIDDFSKHTFKPQKETHTKFKIKDIFKDNWSNFLKDNPDIKLRPVILEEVEKMINCSSYYNGYAVYTCDNCNNYLYVPFTCKSRFCTSCGSKYTLDRAETIAAKCINYPHRHITFTIHEDAPTRFRDDLTLGNVR